MIGCHSSRGNEEAIVNQVDRIKDYIKPIPGKNDSIPLAVIESGKVLIAYSDCSTCHKEDKRSFGPAFRDIAARYPTNTIYIQILSQKVVLGGTGAWGNAVMLAHPKLTDTDAERMVSYILSLK